VAKVCIAGPSRRFFSGVSAFTIRLSNALSGNNRVCALLIRNLLPRFLYPGKSNVGREDFCLDFLPGIEKFDGLDWNSPLSWYRGWRFLRREKPEAIIFQWWSSSAAHLWLFFALLNRFSLKPTLLLEMHEIVDPLEGSLLPVRIYSRLATRLLVRNMQAFIVHSEAVKQELTRLYRIHPNKIHVIPHGVYDSYVQDYPQDSARKKLGLGHGFVLLYFGMIRKYKGIPALIEAFNGLAEEIARESWLVIAGEDWGDEKGLAEMVGSSPYRSRIIFRPQFVPDPQVPLYFVAADVVVLPYHRTAGSGVAGLAVAFGKPLVISDLPGTRESLKDYLGAYFVPAGDPACLKKQIESLFRLWKEGNGMNYQVPDSLDWEHLAKKYQQVIDAAVIKRGMTN
jgi:glycosyltransferase involved in cell wall biosynthesis